MSCLNCKYCKEYKIHKRIIKYHPGEYRDKNGIQHFTRNNGTVYIGWDITDFDDIFICERLKCEPHDDSGCELWEGKDEG